MDEEHEGNSTVKVLWGFEVLSTLTSRCSCVTSLA